MGDGENKSFADDPHHQEDYCDNFSEKPEHAVKHANHPQTQQPTMLPLLKKEEKMEKVVKKVARRTLLPLRKRLQQKKRPDVAEICDWAEPGDCNNNNNGGDQHDLNKDGNLNVGFANNNADAEFK